MSDNLLHGVDYIYRLCTCMQELKPLIARALGLKASKGILHVYNDIGYLELYTILGRTQSLASFVLICPNIFSLY